MPVVMAVLGAVMAVCMGSSSGLGYEARAVNTLGFQIVKEFRKNDPNGNVVFSPITISSAFAMAHAGARGKTREQLDRVFGFRDDFVNYLKRKANESKGRTSTTSYAAKVFVDKSLNVKRDFIKFVGLNRVAATPFSSNPEEAKQLINEFVHKSTRGLIPTIVEDSGSIASTSMALVSAIYFQGGWKHAFDKEYTHKSDFQSSDGTSRTRDFMTYPTEIKLKYKDDYNLDSQILELPYRGGKFSMIIVLPNQPDGWRQVEQKLVHVGQTIISQDRFEERDVLLRLPKFEMEFNFNGLKAALQDLGVTDIFTSSADLSGIADGALQLSDVVHKAKIKVDEEGTQAAAASGLFTSKIWDDPVSFIVSHPFLYFILDKKDGTILFQGTVTSLQ